MIVTGGSTDITTYFSMRLSATGADATALTIADFDLQYVRTRAVPVAKVDATALAATNTAHTDNFGIEVDATDTPGLYRFDWPDAAFAAGVKEAILSVKHTSCFTEHLRVEIDPLGAPAGASVSADIAAVKAQTAAIETDTQDIQARLPAALVSGRIDASVGAMAANVMTAAAAAADLTTELQTGLATAAELAKVPKSDSTVSWNATAAAQIQSEANDALVAYDPPTRTEATSDKDEILTAVGDVPTNAELTTALGTADDAVLAQVALVKAKTDNLPSDPADASVIAGRFDTLDTSVADLPTNAELATAIAGGDDATLAQIALVKTQTDKLTFTVANQIDANIQYVNGVQVTGTGASGSEWGP